MKNHRFSLSVGAVSQVGLAILRGYCETSGRTYELYGIRVENVEKGLQILSLSCIVKLRVCRKRP